MKAMPNLKDLPFSPPDRRGWPWTQESVKLPETISGNNPWPKISIVTPSFNQGEFLEETIRSILLQGYPNLEYIIIDGGSHDNSVDIIKKYEPWLTYWVSEPDRGQSHAINKGFQWSTGSILTWINSDDMLLRNSLALVGLIFESTRFDVLSGNTILVNELGNYLKKFYGRSPNVKEILRGSGGAAPQQSTFFGKVGWETCGPLSEELHYVMDYYFWLCLAASQKKWMSLDIDLAVHRRHEKQKTWVMHQNNLERLKALRIFKSSKFYSSAYRNDLQRALFFEGWLERWNAKYFLSEIKKPYSVYWLMAIFYNWRCLAMPLYFRNARLEITRVIRQIGQKIGEFISEPRAKPPKKENFS